MINYKSFEVHNNTKIKYYKDGSVKVSSCSLPFYKDPEYVISDSSTYTSPIGSDTVDEEIYFERKYKYYKDSIRRSKDKIFDIVKMNDFDFFFTGTISDDCDVDRYDADAVCKKVNTFMYNLVKRHKILRYIFVPEYHSDGAVHYHGFIKLYSPKSIDYSASINPHNGKVIRRGKNRSIVYNWHDWKFGFTTLMQCYGSVNNMAKYFTKYITKSSSYPMKHRYYCGGEVVRTVPTDYVDLDFESIPVPVTSTYFGDFKYITFNSVDDFTDFLMCCFSHYQINNNFLKVV